MREKREAGENTLDTAIIDTLRDAVKEKGFILE